MNRATVAALLTAAAVAQAQQQPIPPFSASLPGVALPGGWKARVYVEARP